jgi:hypothetical protein
MDFQNWSSITSTRYVPGEFRDGFIAGSDEAWHYQLRQHDKLTRRILVLEEIIKCKELELTDTKEDLNMTENHLEFLSMSDRDHQEKRLDT